MSYERAFLLNRIYDELNQREKTKLSLVRPEVIFQNAKTYISNFKAVCDSLHRDMNEVKTFLDKEMKLVSSITGANALCINGRHQLMNIKSHLTEYAKTYLLCKYCNSSNTIIEKRDRITFLDCQTCKASTAIKKS